MRDGSTDESTWAVFDLDEFLASFDTCDSVLGQRSCSRVISNRRITDGMNEQGLSFDDVLRSGLAGPRNAVKLLAVLGYPASVISEATMLLSE